ncbi:hypothetical protein Nepgr_011689 [Nepenthes gracilis]|uniref:RING-type domain-containing protein n=1 Tax=Nepenthes gracilis TaxID=150966 RepID=A0AAD3SET1_NEPGR|nr:hypothetical protein Nepgr_011689 [Nepenthes gracilis]
MDDYFGYDDDGCDYDCNYELYENDDDLSDPFGEFDYGEDDADRDPIDDYDGEVDNYFEGEGEVNFNQGDDEYEVGDDGGVHDRNDELYENYDDPFDDLSDPFGERDYGEDDADRDPIDDYEGEDDNYHEDEREVDFNRVDGGYEVGDDGAHEYEPEVEFYGREIDFEAEHEDNEGDGGVGGEDGDVDDDDYEEESEPVPIPMPYHHTSFIYRTLFHSERDVDRGREQGRELNQGSDRGVRVTTSENASGQVEPMSVQGRGLDRVDGRRNGDIVFSGVNGVGDVGRGGQQRREENQVRGREVRVSQDVNGGVGAVSAQGTGVGGDQAENYGVGGEGTLSGVSGVGETENVENQQKRENVGPSSLSSGSEGGSKELNQREIDDLSCPICMDPWTSDGEHAISCLPCGHIYGISCIKSWLQQRQNSGKCPQCNKDCNLHDIRRLYGPRIAVVDKKMQEKIRSLEARCASLELKNADLCRKEAEWHLREAQLSQHLNQTGRDLDLPVLHPCSTPILHTTGPVTFAYRHQLCRFSLFGIDPSLPPSQPLEKADDQTILFHLTLEATEN